MRKTILIAAGSLAGWLLVSADASAKLGSCDQPIVLGTTISDTGPFSTLTANWHRMTEIFAEEINHDGGVMLANCNKKVPIKFVIYDDQSVPATAVSHYERMATVDEVDLFVGPDWTSMGLPVPTIAEKHRIPMVMANVATPAAYARGLKYMWGTPYPIVPRWSERYFEMLKTVNPKPQSIFFVTHDNPVMKAITDTWSKRAEAQGIKVAGSEIFPQELKDFTSIILKVRSARPDIVYISSFDNPSVPLVQQLRQQKVRAMDVHHTMMTGALASQVGMQDVEGITGELPWYPGIKGDYSDLAERVLKKANIDMFQTIFTMGRFAAYLVMVQAIEKAGVVDREKVREALYKGTFKAPPGPVTFDETGFPNNGAFTLQMQNGKVVIVWPPDLATGKLSWPSPGWR